MLVENNISVVSLSPFQVEVFINIIQAKNLNKIKDLSGCAVNHSQAHHNKAYLADAVSELEKAGLVTVSSLGFILVKPAAVPALQQVGFKTAQDIIDGE